MSSPILKISLFGDFYLTYDDKPLKGLGSLQLQSLLTYLLLNRHTSVSRQKLASLYWSDISDAEGLTNLRRKLYRLRKILPDADRFIEIDSKTIRWLPDAPFWLDVVEFETAIALGATAEQNKDIKTQSIALKTASELYQGELLTSCDDDWLIPERDRLQQLAIANLEKLIALLKRQRDFNAAIIRANQLLKLDPYYEPGYLILMQLHREKGDRASALQTYHQCMTLLREELGVDPSANIQALYQSLLADDSVSEVATTSQTLAIEPTIFTASITVSSNFSLVGRKQEWQKIVNWRDAISLTPLLLITGEAGIGKTRLLEEIVTTTKENLVLWGSGFEAERLRPYGAWIDALRTLPSELTATLPSELSWLLLEGNTESVEDPSIFYDAVGLFLTQLVPQQAILIFDDLQWLDEASIALLHYVVRSLCRSPIKFICTARPQELNQNQLGTGFLRALRRDLKIKEIELKPLECTEIDELVQNFLSHRDFKPQAIVDLQRIYQDSGGNPLFAIETARAISEGGTSNLGNLTNLVGDRLNRLDESARELLPWAAALGRSFEPILLARVADFSLTKLFAAIDCLERQGILRPNPRNPERYDFVHEIILRVAYERLSAPQRKLVHLQIAQKLNQQANSERTNPWEIANHIAYHAAKGGDALLAATSSLQAAKRCLSLFAYAEAAQLSKQGIEYCQKLDAPTRAKLQLQLLQIQVQSGVTKEQIVLLEIEIERAIALASNLGLLEAETFGLEALLKLNFVCDRFPALQTNFSRAREVGQFVSPDVSARILSYSGSCLAGMGREMEKAEALLLEAQSLAKRTGLKLAAINFGLGCVAHYRGQLEAARSYLKQGIILDRIEQNHWDEWLGLAELTKLELEAKNIEIALNHGRDLIAIATKLEGGSEPAFSQALKTLADYAREPTSAVKKLARAIASLQELDAQRKLAYVLTFAAEIDLDNGNLEQAMVRAEQALKAACIVDHPSDITLARAILVRGKWMTNNLEEAKEQLIKLQEYIADRGVSDRAEQKILDLKQQL